METEGFLKALQELLVVAGRYRASLMCAEALPWHCHRSLVADALVVSGVAVNHILGDGKLLVHRITPFARLKGTRIVYEDTVSANTEKNRDD